MTALATLVEPLKRELAVPGTFDTIFPDTDDTALEGSLADGFGEAQLRGFFPTFELTEDDGAYETTEDLTAAGAALVLIFTSMRIIRAQLRALTSSEAYKAGNVEFSSSRASNLLRDELKYLDSRVNAIIAEGLRASRIVKVEVFDNYRVRTAIDMGYGRFAPLELPIAAIGRL
jgi:hypothetical protein